MTPDAKFPIALQLLNSSQLGVAYLKNYLEKNGKRICNFEKDKVKRDVFSSKNDFEFEKNVEILTIEQVSSKSCLSLYAFDTDTNEICLVVTDVGQEELLSAPFCILRNMSMLSN